MNEHYRAFIDFGRSLATERGVNWDMCLNPNGTVVKGLAWNLTELVNDSPPPIHWIRDFGKDVKALEVLSSMRMEEKSPPLEKNLFHQIGKTSSRQPFWSSCSFAKIRLVM